MPQKTKQKVDKQLHREINNSLLNTVASLEQAEQVSAFLEEFLTDTERAMITNRFGTALMLKKGFNYREINRALRVSFSTINKIKQNLKTTKITFEVKPRLATKKAPSRPTT